MSNIRALREQRQAEADDPSEWTQTAVARRIGAGTRTYVRWETEGGSPRGFYRLRLAKLFGVEVADLGVPED